MPIGKQSARHYCDHVDCDKSFRRAEHLNRHKLNHTNSTIQCPQCERLFYRRDLLQRHVSLKHGKASRPKTNLGTSRRTPLRAAEFPADPLMTGTAMETEVEENIENGVLSDLGHIFPFPSSPPDLAENWSWPNESAVFPAESRPMAQPDRNLDIPDLQNIDGTWIQAASLQDLYVSQETYNFLMALRPVIEAHHSFSVQYVTSILNTACQFIAVSLPILHRPTLNLELMQRELCASLFCIGLLVSEQPVLHQIGCDLLAHVRSEVLQYVHEKAIYLTDLGILQAMLLVEFSGMYLADRTAMELSDIFHGTLVTITRRLGVFEMNYGSGQTAVTAAGESEWHGPVALESAKRLAYFVFVLDVEQALFFGHERSILSIYTMKIDLPSEDGGWHAGTQRNPDNATNRAKFHLMCHELLSRTQDNTTVPPNLSQFSSLIVLVGLSSVAVDLLRRQQDPFFDTKQAVSRLRSVLPVVHSRLVAGPDGPSKVHGSAIYHTTVIALCTPLDDLERAANDGFSRTGRTPRHRARAAIIRLLARKVGSEPARHAVQLLKLFLDTSGELNSQSDGSCMATSDAYLQSGPSYSPYEPSSLYFGVLTLWAYIIGKATEEKHANPQAPDVSCLGDKTLSCSTASSTPSAHASITEELQEMEDAVDNDDIKTCQRCWRIIMQNAVAKLALRRNNNAQEYSQVLRSLSDNLSF